MAFKARVGGHQGSGGRRSDPQGKNPGTPGPEGRRGTRKGYEKESLGRQKEQQECNVLGAKQQNRFKKGIISCTNAADRSNT